MSRVPRLSVAALALAAALATFGAFAALDSAPRGGSRAVSSESTTPPEPLIDFDLSESEDDLPLPGFERVPRKHPPRTGAAPPEADLDLAASPAHD